MDSWDHSDILTMLEGGNKQLNDFFNRHELNNNLLLTNRYRTNAAKFYRENLHDHVLNVVKGGEYKGRNCYRKQASSTKKTKSRKTTMSGHTSFISVKDRDERGMLITKSFMSQSRNGMGNVVVSQ